MTLRTHGGNSLLPCANGVFTALMYVHGISENVHTSLPRCSLYQIRPANLVSFNLSGQIDFEAQR